ncbi:MAG: hypothetical protein B6D61_09830 [Bacteroidetes bacterium 4484_249]|nr:MAG: hypothetical protein B6D61_09830 [Bacteroidetes bacterium 4484_249]
MDINAKKVEIINHILIIQNPDTLIRIDRFIHGLDFDDREDKSDDNLKKGSKRVNVVGSKIKSMLNMGK